MVTTEGSETVDERVARLERCLAAALTYQRLRPPAPPDLRPPTG